MRAGSHNQRGVDRSPGFDRFFPESQLSTVIHAFSKVCEGSWQWMLVTAFESGSRPSLDYVVVEGSAADPRIPGSACSMTWRGTTPCGDAVYIASGCPDGLESYLVMIYGHHMSDGTMSADFANFSDRGRVAEGHGEIDFYAPLRTIYLVPKLVSVINANARGVLLEFDDQDELTAYMGRNPKRVRLSSARSLIMRGCTRS